MAKMKSGVRSPTAHRTKEQASRQWQDRMAGKTEKGASQEREDNKKWKQARRDMTKAGKVSPNDGRDVGHKKPLRSGGTNSRSNLTVQSPSKNRGWNKK